MKLKIIYERELFCSLNPGQLQHKIDVMVNSGCHDNLTDAESPRRQTCKEISNRLTEVGRPTQNVCVLILRSEVLDQK